MSVIEERAPDPVRCLEEVSADLVGLLRSGIDPEVVALGEWTIRDVAAHLAGLMGVYAGFVRGEVDDGDSDVESAASRIARANALGVAGRAAMSFDDIVDEIESGVCSFVGELSCHDPAEAISLWQARAGQPHVVAGFALMEFLVHGDDIARAAQRPWPIPTEAARAAFLHSAWGSRGFSTWPRPREWTSRGRYGSEAEEPSGSGSTTGLPRSMSGTVSPATARSRLNRRRCC